MGSPMRKRRVWTTFDDDVDAQESAALDASLAAAKDTTAESGALLSSAKEDLTDHQRWLQAQSDAVQRDRDRHDRWLRRERDLRLASTKKERIRRHRRVVRQRALQAIRQTLVDLCAFFRSWIVFGFGKVARGVRFIARSIAKGAAFVWRAIVRAVSSVSGWMRSLIAAVAARTTQAFAAAGRVLSQAAPWTGSKIGVAARGAGKGVASGAAWSGAKAKAAAQAGGQALSTGSLAVASEAGNLSRKAGSAIGSRLSSTGQSAAALATTTGHGFSTGVSAAAAKASALGASGGRGLSRALAWTASYATAIPSKLYIHVARLGHEVQHFARVRAAVPDAVRDAPRSMAQGSPSQRVEQADEEELRDAAHTASVHVFETYGPHLDSTMLFGQPANDPWADDDSWTTGADVADAKDGVTPRDDEAETDKRDLSDMAARAISFAAVSGVAAETGNMLSSWTQRVRGRAKIFAAWAQRNAKTGSVWLRGQAARITALARTGVDVLASGQDSAIARGANWARKKGLDLSHMMIIAGAVLLLLGGLLIGGGVLMRSTSGSVIAAEAPEETFSKISWAFDAPTLPLAERAVFTLSGSPKSFLINGISITGVNNSDETLTGLEAALSPDVQRPDLRLELAVAPQEPKSGSNEASLVPPGASFRLNFQFPPEAMGSADGISVEDFFESYGGLLLKLRYDADSAERSVIQYLDPEMLKTQLDEVSAQAGESLADRV